MIKLSAPQTKKSLTRQTLLQMALRIGVVILICTGISYLHLVSSLTGESLDRLTKYITERGQRERTIFTLAIDNQTIFKKHLERQLKEWGDRDPKEEFDRVFVRWADGTTRNRVPSGIAKNFDSTRYTSVFIGQRATIDADLRRRVLASYELCNNYGPAWNNRFVNIFVTLPENVSLTYWPNVPWGTDAKSDLDIVEEEFFYVADRKNNPERKPVATGLYFDPVVKVWMVSLLTPIDDAAGRHLVTVGHDIVLKELMERTLKDHLEGAYNLLLRADGRLIAHPDRVNDIQNAKGRLDMTQSGDPHLKRIYEQVKNRKPNQVIVDNAQDNEYLAVARIDEPDWFLVTVLPKAIVTQPAFDTARFVLLLGFASLVVELVVLYFVLQNQVAAPIGELMQSTQKIADGDFSPVNIQRDDEVGVLADSFNHMAHKLQASFSALETANQELETRVEERTSELKAANAEISLLNDRLQEDNLRMGAELNVARRLQQMILPEAKELQKIPDLDIAGFMEAATEVGGDYYDVIQQNGRTTIGIGDVTGHGLESGVMMIVAQTAIRTLLAAQEYSPVKFLGVVNQVIYQNAQRMSPDKSLTLSLLDYKDGQLRIIGQHEEVLVVRSGGVVERIDTMDLGFPIGIVDDIDAFISQIQVPLNSGDSVVLYTDGITEARNENRKFYGLERLIEVVEANWQHSANKMVSAVVNDLRQHIGTHVIHDDITLVVMKKK